jgi:hypothetical protein
MAKVGTGIEMFWLQRQLEGRRMLPQSPFQYIRMETLVTEYHHNYAVAEISFCSLNFLNEETVDLRFSRQRV